MRCSTCGADQTGDRASCASCGAALVRRCPDCKSDTPADFRFCGRCGKRLPDSLPATADAPASAAGPERRVVTTVFVDLVGSTALSTQVDPEDLREILQAYRGTAAQIIRSLGGHVANLIGDGLLVLFGYPTAHGDDPERAIMAGLRIVEEVAGLHHPKAPELHVRVGIATGLVVVGRLDVEGAAEKDSVVGETPNLAARIQSVAEPDMVLVAEETRQAVGDLFEVADVGTHRFKGIAGPTRVFRVLGRREHESRFEARARASTPLVGRDGELAELLRRWERAAAGAGEAVTLLGEPGIGKSRLARALHEALSGTPHVRVRFQCSPFHTTSPLHPVQVYLGRAAGIVGPEDPETKLERLERLLSPIDGEAMGLVADMMSIPSHGRYPAAALPPAKRKERTREELSARILGLAKSSPLLLTLEDAHWIDPTTLELVQALVKQAASHRMLVLVTARPEIRALWKEGLPDVLPLDRLRGEACDSLVRAVPGAARLPEEVIRSIVDRTDGMPLYVEVLTEAVLASGTSKKLPSSLQDSLMARLDQLGICKEVAQVAACIGRSFSRELLQACDPALDLRRGLIVLEEAGLILQVGTTDAPRFAFKHALVRDTAYESLLIKRRENVHASIARAIEDRFPEQAEAEPEVVAQHYTLARIPGPAVDYWHAAGRRSSERSANTEAVAQLQMAQELLKGMPSTPERDRKELRVCVDLAGPLIATRGYGAPELDQVIRRALVLSRRIEGTRELFPVLYGRWVFHTVTGKMIRARELCDEHMSLAELQATVEPRMVALRMLGTSDALLGDAGPARVTLEKVLDLYDPARHRTLMFEYGQDIRVSALCYLALALQQTGHLEAAAARAGEALDAARAADHANTLGYATMHVALIRALQGDVTGVRECAKAASALVANQEMRLWAATGRFFEGWTMSQESPESGIPLMTAAAQGIVGGGVKLFRPMFLGWKADAEARAGKRDDAKKTLADAFAVVDDTAERWLVPTLSTMKATVESAQ